MHFIEREVTKLKKTYNTIDPFKICHEKNIECKIMSLYPNINGIYQYIEKNKYIYINSNLSKYNQIYTCYHHLGHAILHEDYNCIFPMTFTNLHTNQFEKEAGLFTACFLVPHLTAILGHYNLSFEEISLELNVLKEYWKMKLEYEKNILRFDT